MSIRVVCFFLDYSEHLFSAEDLEKLPSSPRRVDKRHAVCKEMLETEENYLKALKIIVQVKVFLELLEGDSRYGLEREGTYSFSGLHNNIWRP